MWSFASWCKLRKKVDQNCDAIAGILNSETEQEICTGPFVFCSTRTGWWPTFAELEGGTSTWSAVHNNTGNVPTMLGAYVPLGAVRRTPDCVTDVQAVAHLGNLFAYMRRTRAYIYVDVRLLCNGIVRESLTYDMYHYIDERTETTDLEPLQYRARPTGTNTLCCANVPANSDLQVEARIRYRTAGAQDLNYFRIIGGLRSRASFTAIPREIVVGRST